MFSVSTNRLTGASMSGAKIPFYCNRLTTAPPMSRFRGSPEQPFPFPNHDSTQFSAHLFTASMPKPESLPSQVRAFILKHTPNRIASIPECITPECITIPSKIAQLELRARVKQESYTLLNPPLHQWSCHKPFEGLAHNPATFLRKLQTRFCHGFSYCKTRVKKIRDAGCYESSGQLGTIHTA